MDDDDDEDEGGGVVVAEEAVVDGENWARAPDSESEECAPLWSRAAPATMVEDDCCCC